VEPYYAISWVLTWFAHDVDQWSTVTRLYDAFLAAHPMLCLYLAAALVARSYPDILHQVRRACRVVSCVVSCGPSSPGYHRL
jgi:hypothetical protein